MPGKKKKKSGKKKGKSTKAEQPKSYPLVPDDVPPAPQPMERVLGQIYIFYYFLFLCIWLRAIPSDKLLEDKCTFKEIKTQLHEFI